MTISILSENGRGRLLCGWAIARGFQVNMVLTEDLEDSNAIKDFPFGEFVIDENTDWVQDYILDSRTIDRDFNFSEMSLGGMRPLTLSVEKTLFSSHFDLNEVAGLALKNPSSHWWHREWDAKDWKKQMEKFKNLGVNFAPDDPSFYGVTFDFRSQLKTYKPLWQWCSFIIEWDPGVYADVMVSPFVWVQNREEYLAYENLAFVQKVEEANTGHHQWQVYMKIPFTAGPESENLEPVIAAWIKNFCERLKWAQVKWTGDFKLWPFYQWKKPVETETNQRSEMLYDVGPRMLGSYSFQNQWKLEKKIYDALTDPKNQRKKSAYDFKIL